MNAQSEDLRRERLRSSLSAAFVSVLRTEREKLNRRFAARVQLSRELDGDAFLWHFASLVDPIVASVSEILPECARNVTMELFDVSMELFAANVIGPRSTTTAIMQVWQEILPRIPHLVSREAAVVAGSLSNAAHNVARMPGTRQEFWVREMAAMAPVCEKLTQLLDFGKVLAWRAGMVQYRVAAVETASSLPVALAAKSLGLATDTTEERLARVLDRIRRSPWNRAEDPANAVAVDEGSQLRVVLTVGDFRGLGGVFLRPPVVSCADNHLIVSDGDSNWQLLADCYGSLLLRLGSAGDFQDRKRAGREQIKIDKLGRIAWNGVQGEFPQLAGAKSYASNSDTLAVTLDDSHRVFLLAVI